MHAHKLMPAYRGNTYMCMAYGSQIMPSPRNKNSKCTSPIHQVNKVGRMPEKTLPLAPTNGSAKLVSGDSASHATSIFLSPKRSRTPNPDRACGRHSSIEAYRSTPRRRSIVPAHLRKAISRQQRASSYQNGAWSISDSL